MSTPIKATVLKAVLALALLAPAAEGAVVPSAVPIQVQETIAEDLDLSAVAALGASLVVGADEAASLQVLDPVAGGFAAGRLVPLLPGDEEADIEGIAAVRRSDDGPWTVFAIGCHCGNRKKVEEDKTVAKNLERLAKVDQEGSRAHVFRLEMDAAGRVQGQVQRRSLAPFLRDHPLLGRFAGIPSKENGIDIEGLAVGPDGRLFAGFRGPVLRGNFVPVLAFELERPEAAELRFVDLGGLGIRDIAAVRGGFLLLAGPVGEGRPDFRIFFWNGVDAVPGRDRTEAPTLADLGEVPVPDPAAKAEGLAVLSESERQYQVLLVFDGVAGGHPTRFTVDKPAR